MAGEGKVYCQGCLIVREQGRNICGIGFVYESVYNYTYFL